MWLQKEKEDRRKKRKNKKKIEENEEKIIESKLRMRRQTLTILNRTPPYTLKPQKRAYIYMVWLASPISHRAGH